MNDPRDIRISEYNYTLPDERIAKYPMAQRDASKLLIYDKGEITHTVFSDITTYLPEKGLMVFNNTRVIQARLHFRKDTGALIEVFLLEPETPADYERMFQTRRSCQWLCLIGNMKKWKTGRLKREIMAGDRKVCLEAEHKGTKGTSQCVELTWDDDTVSFAEILDACGELPIPPYLNRESEESDKTTYQTVYSKIKGSVAAPTAGLHFTDEVLEDIDRHGIEREELTLHVGAGTFRPVKAEKISGHDMHTEYVAVRRHTIERLIAYGGKAIAVGTTSVRTLESLYYIGRHILSHPDNVTDNDMHVRQWEPYEENGDDITPTEALEAIVRYLDRSGMDNLHASTQIIIAPGYNYHIVNRLITNFHQPQSTLLLLVSAFVGEDWRKIYRYAMDNAFRFLSYGDSSMLIPGNREQE